MLHIRFRLILLVLLFLEMTDPRIAFASPLTPSEITVLVYRLEPNGTRWTDPITGDYHLCSSGDTYFGCTAFVGNDNHSYPYKTINPVTIPIETDYLLDVVPQEVSPDVFHPAAIRAQAIAARSYAYWHITHATTINNSSSYQVFIPYQFEALEPVTFPENEDNPCASTNLNASQQQVCDAIQLLRYITYEGQPAFTEFFADIRLHTLTNPTDADSDGQLDYPYLLGIQDPISWEPTIVDEGHGHGMSQKGASRWGWGNSGYRGDLTPWPVHWEHAEQILTHYYTGIEIRSYTDYNWTPPYRWLGLWHDIPPDLELDQTHLVTVVAQNSGVNTWYADSIDEQNVALSFQLLGPSGSCLYNCDGLTYHSMPHNVAPGEVITLTPTIYLPSVFPCNLTLRWDMVALPPGSQAQQIEAPAVDFWFYEQWPPWYPLDIPLVECPCHVYLPTIQRE